MMFFSKGHCVCISYLSQILLPGQKVHSYWQGSHVDKECHQTVLVSQCTSFQKGLREDFQWWRMCPLGSGCFLDHRSQSRRSSRQAGLRSDQFQSILETILWWALNILLRRFPPLPLLWWSTQPLVGKHRWWVQTVHKKGVIIINNGSEDIGPAKQD